MEEVPFSCHGTYSPGGSRSSCWRWLNLYVRTCHIFGLLCDPSFLLNTPKSFFPASELLRILSICKWGAYWLPRKLQHSSFSYYKSQPCTFCPCPEWKTYANIRVNSLFIRCSPFEMADIEDCAAIKCGVRYLGFLPFPSWSSMGGMPFAAAGLEKAGMSICHVNLLT